MTKQNCIAQIKQKARNTDRLTPVFFYASRQFIIGCLRCVPAYSVEDLNEKRNGFLFLPEIGQFIPPQIGDSRRCFLWLIFPPLIGDYDHRIVYRVDHTT